MNNEILSVGFIGAGRVGFTLGRYFYEKNLKISGYYSKTSAHADEAAAFTHSKSYRTIKELAADSRIIFITVPDASIYDVYLQLKDYELKNKILCHCSGALSAQVFKGIELTGAYGFSVHPVFAISDKEHSYKQLSKAFFTLEGNEGKMPVMKELLGRLGNPFQIICAENKHKYHASLVMASNLVIGLYHTALSTLKECGFSDDTANEVLKPLFINNAESICQNGCINALTGPVDRNDVSTISEHLSALHDKEAVRKVYTSLTGQLITLAKLKYPDRDYEELENVLNRESD